MGVAPANEGSLVGERLEGSGLAAGAGETLPVTGGCQFWQEGRVCNKNRATVV